MALDESPALGRGRRGRREEPSLRRVARRAPAVELDAGVGRHAAARARARRAAARRARRRRPHAQLLQHLPNTTAARYVPAYCAA